MVEERGDNFGTDRGRGPSMTSEDENELTNDEVDEEEDVSEEEDEDEEEEDDDESEDDEDGGDDEGDEEDDEEDDEEELLAADIDSDNDELPACPICLDRLKIQDVGLPESCDHQFCLECLLEWSRNVNTCPIDRQPFNIILARHPGEDKVFKRISVEDHHLNDVEMLEEEEDTTACEVCGQSDREDRLLLCDGCDNGYHCECLNPPLEDVPVEEWFCPICSEINRQADAEAKEQGETDLPIRAHRRRIARTRVSERVRHRIQIFRLNERRPLELMSSEDEQTIDHSSATPATHRKTPQKAGVRKIRKRRCSRKRKSTKKRKTTKKGATTGTSPKGKKRKTRKRKRKTRRRKGTKKRKVSCRTTSAARRGPSLTSQAFSIPLSQTIKGRIAERLGLSKPPPGRTIPLQRRPGDRGVDVRRGDSFSAGLSILGDRDELIQFHDVDDEFPATQMHPVIKNTDKAMLASLIMKKEHVKRAIPASRIAEGVPVLASGPASFDLLGSIFQEQSLLHMDSSHVHICRDGSLKATKAVKMPACTNPPSVPSAQHISMDHDIAEGNPDSQPFNDQPAEEGEPGGESPDASTQDTTSAVNVTSSGQPSSTSEQVASSSTLPEQQTSALSSSSASLGSEDDRLFNVPAQVTDSPHLVPKENDYPEKKRKVSRWSDASLDAGPASSSSDKTSKTDTNSVKTSDIDTNQEPVTTTNDNVNDNSVSDIEGCSSGNDNSILAFGDEDTAKRNTLWTTQKMDNILSQDDTEEGEIIDSETGITYEMHSVSDKGNIEDVLHADDMELEEDVETQNKEEEEIDDDDDEEEEGEGRVGAPFTLASFLSQLAQNPDFAQTSTSGSAATEDDPKPNQMMEYVHGCYVRVNRNKVDITDLDKRLDALSRQRREERYLLQMYGIEQERFQSDERKFDKDREERSRDRDDRPRESRYRSRSGSRDRRRRSRSKEGRRSRRSKSRSRSRSPEKKSQKRQQDAGEDEVKGEERSWRSRGENDRQDRYGDRSKNRDRDAGSRRRSRSPKPGREDYGGRRISLDDSDRFARTGWRANQDQDRRGEGGRRGRGYGWDSGRGGYENNRNRDGGGYREDRGLARSSRQGDWNARGNNSKPGDSSYRQSRFDSDPVQGQQEVSQDREAHSSLSLAGDSAYNKQDTFPSKQLPLQQMSHQLHQDLYNQPPTTSFISPTGQGQALVSSYAGQTQAPSSSAGFPPWMSSSQPPPDFSQPPPPPSSINLLSNGDFDSLKKSLALLTGMGNSASPAGTPGILTAQPIYHMGSLGPTAAQSANAFPSLPLQTASGYGVGTIPSIPTPAGAVPTPPPVEPWRNYKQAQSTGFGEQSFSEPAMSEGTSGEAHVEDVQLDIPVPPSGDQTKDFQEQVIEEVKVAIRPFYASKQISKDQYKEILRKCVPKVCNSGEINSRKIGHLVAAYVKKMQATRQK